MLKKIIAIILSAILISASFSVASAEDSLSKDSSYKETETEPTTEETEKQTEKQTEKETQKETEKQTEKETEKSTEKQTEKETEKSTESTSSSETTTKKPVSNNKEITGTKSISLEVSDTYDLSRYVSTDISALKYSWSSDSEKIARVSDSGIVTARKKGTAKITAKYNTGTTSYKYTFDVDVYGDGKITKTREITIYTGDKKDLSDYVSSRISASKYTWRSSSKSIASVSSKGVITGEKKGTAEITAKYDDDEEYYNYVFKITVKNSSSYDDSSYTATNTKNNTKNSTASTKSTNTVKTTKPAAPPVSSSGASGSGAQTPLLYSFTDISHRKWAVQSISEMAQKGFIKGTGGTLFMPDSTCTRADFSIVLSNIFGFTGTPSSNYTDVPADSYYCNYVGLLKEQGIEAGISDNKFRPSEPITREEIMVMAYKALMKFGVSMSDDTTVLSKYTDNTLIKEENKKAVAALINLGVVSGTDKGIEPAATITRAQMAVLLNKVYKLI